MKIFLQKYIREIILIILLFILVGRTLVSSGGIILLDYIPVPNPIYDISKGLFIILLDVGGQFLGYQLISKFVFISILITSYYLGIFLTRGISEKFSFQKSSATEILIGIFFVINPFAYERMMVQPVIYLGIILLGWMLYFLFFGKNFKKFLWAGLCASLAFNLFLHASFMIALVFLVFIIFFARKKSDFLGILTAGIIVIFLNLNWILAPFFNITNSTSYIETFNPANFEAFLTQSLAPINVWFTNIFLYGFWGEKFSNHYASVQFLSSLWFLAGAVIFLFSLFGLYLLFVKNFKKFAYSFIIIFCLSLIFGIGIASPWLRDLTLFMAENIPFWQGYREPQKWIGLVMIIEGILLSVSLLWVFQKFGKDIVVKISIIISVLLIFFTWSPGPLFSYQGQLKTTIYPQGFENLRTNLLQENFSGKILALPWHSYLGCSWTGRPTIANPISGLLSPLSVTVANNIEVGDILYSNYSDEKTKNIENFIAEKNFEFFKKTDFTHIIFMKNCASSANYDFLENIPNCHKKEDNSALSFYECTK